MKRLSIAVLALLMSVSVMAQTEKNDIIGDWYNADKDAIINIYEKNGTYHGKITWMLHPLDENGQAKTDPLNPDETLRSRARLGMVMMYDFEYEGDSEWDEGEIYDPKSGSTYSGTMTLTSANQLDLRGYVGIPLFGRTSTWSRKTD